MAATNWCVPITYNACGANQREMEKHYSSGPMMGSVREVVSNHAPESKGFTARARARNGPRRAGAPCQESGRPILVLSDIDSSGDGWDRLLGYDDGNYDPESRSFHGHGNPSDIGIHRAGSHFAAGPMN